MIYSRQPTWHWSQATKGAGGSIIGGRPWRWWRRQVCCLFPFAAAKCICAGVFVTVAMCVPGTGVQRDGCHQWLIIARRPQTSGWERVDDGARPGQLSVPWVMGQEILVRELVAQGLAAAISGVLQASEIPATTDCSVHGMESREEERRKPAP